jgi:hypothetical protein
LSREKHNVVEAEAVDRAEGKMCGPALRGTDAPPRRRPHRVQRERIGTWETSSGPQSLRRSRTATASLMKAKLSGNRRGVGRVRRGPAIRGVSGGGECGGKGRGRGKGKRRAIRRTPSRITQAIPVGRPRIGAEWATRPECRSRSTLGRSPVRESRTPGSVRGALSNERPYRDP